MITLYGNDVSVFSNVVKLTANALGTPYTFQRMDFRAGDLRTPQYLAIHPAGKLPAISDGDFTLFESGAIIRYLADREGSSLYPKDLRQRAKVEQWLDFVHIHVGTAMGKVLFNRVLAPAMKMPVDEQSLKDGIKFFERFLPVIDAQLEKNSYLVSDALSLADIILLAILDPAELAGLDLAPYPNVTRWRKALKQEKFYTASFTSYEDLMKAAV